MRKLKVNLIALCGIALCGLLLAGIATPTDAQTPGTHPGYLHAISDLRQAHDLLKSNFAAPAQAQAAAAAIPAVEAAIGDLIKASKVDNKNLAAVAPFDDKLPPVSRLHKAADLLKAAHREASGPESDPSALPLPEPCIGAYGSGQRRLSQGLLRETASVGGLTAGLRQPRTLVEGTLAAVRVP